jgi:hypothetical protein
MKNTLIIGLLILASEVHAQLRYYPPNPNETPQQQAADVTARQQAEERQYQIEQQQQEIQSAIDILNRDISEKSNRLVNVFVQEYEKTNISERLSELSTDKRKLPKDPWRKIDGKPIFATGSGFYGYTGKVLQTTSEGILFQSYPSLDKLFIRNFPYVYTDGAEISFEALPSTPYSYTSVLGGDNVVNSADYGIPCSPPDNAHEVEEAAFRITPEEQQQIKKSADSALAEIEKAKAEYETAKQNLHDFYQKFADARQAVMDAQAKKKKEIADKALKYNQDLADKGDAYGLQRMAERYRDGEDVEKDLAKARDCFQKAISAGSETASNELVNLPAN